MLCSFMISVHPEVEAKVLAELQALQLMPSAAQPHPRTMTYDEIANLTYTCNTIKVCTCLSRRSHFLLRCSSVMWQAV